MMSVLYSYRLVDGELVTLDDIKMSRYLYTKEEYQQIKDKFKKSAKLYDKISVKNGKLYIEDQEFARAWENKKFVGISTQAPIFEALVGKRAGDKIEFNGIKYTIEEILQHAKNTYNRPEFSK